MNQELACLSLAVKTERINELYRVISVEEPGLAKKCRAGNFFELRSSAVSSRKLFKPISVYRVDGSEISFLIKRLGPGSEALCDLKTGDLLELYGPLGNSFPLVSDAHILLVSGGVGYPPLAGLKSALDSSNHVFSLHGATTSLDRFPADEIWQIEGSSEHQGFVTEGILQYLERASVDLVYACGPSAMLKAVSMICAARGIRAYVSMEAYMACGIGACHGCVIPVGDASSYDYQRVCKEGPVFDAASIVWELI